MSSNIGLTNQAGELVGDGMQIVHENLREKLHLSSKEGVLEPMDVEELEICKELINEFYPLKSKKTYELLPWLCCCVKLKNTKSFELISSEFKKLTEDTEDDDWKLNDLREVNDRLTDFI